jgi:hypothetical protein
MRLGSLRAAQVCLGFRSDWSGERAKGQGFAPRPAELRSNHRSELTQSSSPCRARLTPCRQTSLTPSCVLSNRHRFRLCQHSDNVTGEWHREDVSLCSADGRTEFGAADVQPDRRPAHTVNPWHFRCGLTTCHQRPTSAEWFGPQITVLQVTRQGGRLEPRQA